MHSALILAGLALPLITYAAPAPAYSPRVRLPGTLWARQDDGSCDLSTVNQPSNTMTPPDADLTLVLIAEGRGTQNYTCADPTAEPAPIGALATLYNASCAVASGNLGSIEEDAASIGAHFFIDTTTPDFDIIGLGTTLLKKNETMAAPEAANCPWLKLQAQEQGTTSAIKQIYRLNTVGGLAPTSCEGQDAGATVTVDYTAQYWVYASTEEVQKRRARRSLGLPVV